MFMFKSPERRGRSAGCRHRRRSEGRTGSLPHHVPPCTAAVAVAVAAAVVAVVAAAVAVGAAVARPP